MKQVQTLFYVTILIILLAACNEDDIDLTESTNSTVRDANNDSEDMMVIGKEIENPYSIKYMRMAFNDMTNGSISKSSPNYNLEANCLYVRFLPKDMDEFEKLYADTTIELFDYPLLNEIEVEGDYYHDPTLPEDAITWQYTTVPVNYKFPNIRYEILDSCFIPDDYEQTLSKKFSNFDTDRLTYLAFKYAGQEDEYQCDISKKRQSPSGQFRVYDNYQKTLVGISNVKVRVKNFIRWANTYTDTKGIYSFNKHFASNRLHYSIIFRSRDSVIINNLMFDVDAARKNLGSHSKSGYSEDFTSDTAKVWMWATVNNAVQIYKRELCPKFGVPVPNTKLHIFIFTRIKQRAWTGCTPMARHMNIKFANWQTFCINVLGITGIKWIANGIGPDIMIADINRTQNLYTTVFHEMSHVCHYMKAGKEYWQPYVKFVTQHYGYGNRKDRNSGYVGVGEMWGYYFGDYICGKEYFKIEGTPWKPREFWFMPDILKMAATAVPLSPKQVYNCLSSDIVSHELLKQKLIKQYGNKEDIVLCFKQYGF